MFGMCRCGEQSTEPVRMSPGFETVTYADLCSGCRTAWEKLTITHPLFQQWRKLQWEKEAMGATSCIRERNDVTATSQEKRFISLLELQFQVEVEINKLAEEWGGNNSQEQVIHADR